MIETARLLGIQLRFIKSLSERARHIFEENPERFWDTPRYLNALSKLNVFDIHDFDKVIYIDSDVLALSGENPDVIFQFPLKDVDSNGQDYPIYGDSMITFLVDAMSKGIWNCERRYQKCYAQV